MFPIWWMGIKWVAGGQCKYIYSFLHVHHHATMFPIWLMGIKWVADIRTYQTRFSFRHLGHAPGVMLGGQNFNFLNMAMWHIKLKGMISRPEYNEQFYHRIKLVTLGRGQKVKYH